MVSFFKELFDYTHHFNEQLIEVFQEQPEKIPAKASELFSHMLNAQHIWNNRILNTTPSFGVWQSHQIDAFSTIEQDNFKTTGQILDSKDLATIIDYKTSKGIAFSSSVRDILFHVVNHSTYHRAQIATAFKESGLTPLMTDFIYFKR